MVTLLGEEAIVTVLSLPHEALEVLLLRLRLVLFHNPLVKPLLFRDCVAKHGFLIKDKHSLMHLGHDAHLELLFKKFLSMSFYLLVIFLDVLSLFLDF